MAAFHVFVEGSVDSSPTGVERLAAAIAGHYGLPVGELNVRLAKGRFRVKGNCDRATADSYVRDLTQLGARCSVEDADAPPSRASTPAIATPPRGTPTAPRATTPPASKSSPMKSGLAAAFSSTPDGAPASLGALDGNATFTLAAVDGAEDAAPPAPAASFAPPPSAAAAPVAKSKPKPAAAAPAAAEPIDMFAPPDAAEEAAFKVELADDEVERAAKKRVSIPPAEVPIAPAPEAPSRVSRVSIQPATVGPAPRGMADPKTRFALGVLVGIVVGFVPAHLLASVRESSAYAEIDKAVDQTQREADTQDAYDALDAFRSRELARKYDARHSAAILAFLVWAVIGGGVAYVWFRRIRWPDE